MDKQQRRVGFPAEHGGEVLRVHRAARQYAAAVSIVVVAPSAVDATFRTCHDQRGAAPVRCQVTSAYLVSLALAASYLQDVLLEAVSLGRQGAYLRPLLLDLGLEKLQAL